MGHSRLGLLGLLIILACANGLHAKLIGLVPLESRAPPFYSTKYDELGVAAFFQTDGRVTFLRSPEVNSPLNFSCSIDKAHQASAYIILGIERDSVRLLAAQDGHMFQLLCYAASGSCDPQYPIVPTPISFNGHVLAMQRVKHSRDLVYAATLENFFVFSVGSMKSLGSFRWSGKPFVTQYGMDAAAIVQVEEREEGNIVLIALSGANVVNDHGKTAPYTRPGMVVTVLVSQRGDSVKLVTTTLLDTSPMTMHVPDTPFSPLYYWTQISNDSNYAYVNSLGGWPETQPIRIPLFNQQTGLQQISPTCFGDYPITGTGLLAFGTQNFSQSFLQLHFAYGQGQPPEITVGELQVPNIRAGVLNFVQQPNSLLPYLHGISQAPSGFYQLETYEIASRDRTFMQQIASRTKSSNSKISSLPKRSSSSMQTILPKNSLHPLFARNCSPSDCSFENPGKCPPDHCWSFGGAPGFFCCLKPPY